MKSKLFILFFFQTSFLFAQIGKNPQVFSHDDTLRGSITPERLWWDLKFYELRLRVSPDQKYIEGTNVITYKVLNAQNVLQIDLQPPLSIKSIFQDGQELFFKKDGSNAYMVQLQKTQIVGNTESIKIYYAGKPKVARRAPWDGGFSWGKDTDGNPFVATSCQGLGSSVWWPCKDHMYDEPDSMLIGITVPNSLMDVSNGRLRKVIENQDNTKTYEWFVSNPINNYGVNVNIGNYSHFSEEYEGEKGALSLNYYVLPEHLDLAKEQFKDVKRMLKAFEHWFGPYPFYEDGYKLVEVPYLGMEHQSSVTYGNKFKNGYLGSDLSGTGWGLKGDFIIIHESGHEWFANNITYKDIADMWIHESFTNYSENLFTEYYYGKEAGAEYVIGTRKKIQNDRPIIGVYNVNHEGSSDMYYKGGNMLHTIRQIINDDDKWRGILRGLNSTFYHQTVTSKQIEEYISQQAGIDFSKVFDQYLRNTAIPTLEYQQNGKKLSYKWTTCIDGFNMPVKVKIDGKEIWLKPSTKTQKLKTSGTIEVDKNFYVLEKLGIE